MSDAYENLDLLYGSRAIAEFMGIKPRAAEHLIEQRRIPFFRVGRTICARRTKLIAALEELEAEASAG